MKFQVRDGFAVKRLVRIELPEGNFEHQESSTYAGQMIDLDAGAASQHSHQLEPRDAEAIAWMESKHLVVSEPGPFGLSQEQLGQIARHMLAAQGAAQSPSTKS